MYTDGGVAWCGSATDPLLTGAASSQFSTEVQTRDVAYSKCVHTYNSHQKLLHARKLIFR